MENVDSAVGRHLHGGSINIQGLSDEETGILSIFFSISIPTSFKLSISFRKHALLNHLYPPRHGYPSHFRPRERRSVHDVEQPRLRHWVSRYDDSGETA